MATTPQVGQVTPLTAEEGERTKRPGMTGARR
jgi:hypothetical protein